jgi:hypothetical protein
VAIKPSVLPRFPPILKRILDIASVMSKVMTLVTAQLIVNLFSVKFGGSFNSIEWMVGWKGVASR